MDVGQSVVVSFRVIVALLYACGNALSGYLLQDYSVQHNCVCVCVCGPYVSPREGELPLTYLTLPYLLVPYPPAGRDPHAHFAPCEHDNCFIQQRAPRSCTVFVYDPTPNEHTSEGGRDDRGVPYHAGSTLGRDGGRSGRGWQRRRRWRPTLHASHVGGGRWSPQ